MNSCTKKIKKPYKICKKEGSVFSLIEVPGTQCPNCPSPVILVQMEENRIGHLVNRERKEKEVVANA